MEAAAKKFEREESIMHQVQQHSRHSDDFILLSSIFPVAERDGYFPYCDINFESNLAVPKTECQSHEPTSNSPCYPFMLCSAEENLRTEFSDASISRAPCASTLSSFVEQAESITTIGNVRSVLVCYIWYTIFIVCLSASVCLSKTLPFVHFHDRYTSLTLEIFCL